VRKRKAKDGMGRAHVKASELKKKGLTGGS
jgi:hypothetical protein